MSQLVNDRLDNMQKALPEQSEPEPFEQYMARAAERAARDPLFKDEFERAVKQYKTLGG